MSCLSKPEKTYSNQTERFINRNKSRLIKQLRSIDFDNRTVAKQIRAIDLLGYVL